MLTQLLYIHPALVALGLFVVLVVASEVGYQVGRRAQGGSESTDASQISTIQGAALGVLALLLGFTFVMAVARFDVRQDLVVAEANAIHTTALRGRVLLRRTGAPSTRPKATTRRRAPVTTSAPAGSRRSSGAGPPPSP